MRVTPIQRGDKKMTCKDIILEINEVEHKRDQAVRSRAISSGEALMPVCWVSGVMSADQAIRAADDRIEYLGNIYDLLNCGGPPVQAGAPGPGLYRQTPAQLMNVPQSLQKMRPANSPYLYVPPGRVDNPVVSDEKKKEDDS